LSAIGSLEPRPSASSRSAPTPFLIVHFTHPQ
jgi:hypothetical protein